MKWGSIDRAYGPAMVDSRAMGSFQPVTIAPPDDVDLHSLPLSALAREKQRLAYALAVDNMARTLRETVKQVDGLMADRAVDHNSAVLHKADYDGHIRWHDTHQRELASRLDALERDAAVGRAFRSASFMARLRWLVGR